MTGTVTESEPTTDRRLGGTTITAGGVTVAADSSGNFTFPNLAAGTHTLRAARGGYVEQTATITLPGDSTTVGFKLDPIYDTITVERTDSLGHGEDCPGHLGNFSCFTYSFPAHHARGVEANLYWHSSDARLELEFRCNGFTYVRTEGGEPRLVEFNREPYFNFRILEDAKRGQTCELRVLHIKGEPMAFILRASHPN